ncbi:MAG: preprotein translocase subunit SecG [Alphaproteobacteria bacterium]|jgi:preprotein translocase subunit SecG|nr:preprotein translocase subunit SecG [Thalassospira sp.]MCE2965168.1 preprotein translocase subunit SecG [Alphaproteobacteria bacterium]
MQAVVLVILLIVTVLMIAIILLQKSEGGGLASSSQMSGVMSARGTATMLTRSTWWMAAIFLSLSLMLAYLAKVPSSKPSLADEAAKISTEQPAAPAVPMAQ